MKERRKEKIEESKRLKISKIVKSMLFAFILVASTIFANAGLSQASSSANLWVSPPELTVQVGSTFSVDVVVNSTSTPVSFFDVFLHFNPSAVNALGGGGGGGAYSPFIMTYYYVDNTAGFIEVRGEYPPGVEDNNIKLVHWILLCITWITGHLDLSGSQILDPDHQLINPIYGSGSVTQTWPFKPHYVDYAPSGVPDFSQKQIGPAQLGIGWWKNPVTGKWSWCGPTAVANSLWWMDSRFETSTTPPPTINDTFPLVQSYTAGSDDHDPVNVPWLIANLSRYMDTDGSVTGISHNGTEVHDMAQGIKNYILAHGLQDKFYVNLVKKPTFNCICLEVTACEDTILLLGYWQEQPQGSGHWVRVGGHFVTIPGTDSVNNKIYFCDPLTDNAELTGQGTVIPPPPHNHPVAPDPVHNNATYISYDRYNIMPGVSPSPGGVLGINYTPSQYYDMFPELQQENCPNEFESMQGNYIAGQQVFTEVEYGVFMSPSPALYWKLGYPDYAPSGMPDFDEKQDKWAKPGVNGLGNWTYCAPVSVANSLWWLDSEFEPGTTPPPTKSDGFNLVTSYNKTGWDDHDPRNVPYLIQHLAYLMDTDGQRTNQTHYGTNVTDMETGLAQYLSWTGVNPPGDVNGDGVVNNTDLAIVVAANNTKPGDAHWNMAADIYPVTLGWPTPGKADNVGNQSDINLVKAHMNENGTFSERTIKAPDFDLIQKEVEKCEDVVLTIGFWWFDGTKWTPENYTNPGIPPNTPKKHAVTVAGVNSTTFKIAISDPDLDAFETGLITEGRVPVLHTHTSPEPPYTTHNNASLVSQDIYNVSSISPPSPVPCPAGNWAIVGYGGYGASPPAQGMYAVIENAIITSPLGVHDVASTNVTTSKTVVAKGYCLNLNVTVANQGDYEETFNVTVYANTTSIAAQTVTLASGNSTSIIFKWNTTGFAKGNYTIKAIADTVLGEIHTTDNTHIDSIVCVSTPGDINGDTYINIKDAVLLGVAFSANHITDPSDPRYCQYWRDSEGPFNPNTDINSDGWINIKDAVLLGTHFGLPDP